MPNKTSGIQRTVTIKLDEYNVKWAGSYIIVATRGFRDNMDFQKKISKLEKKLKKEDRKLKIVGAKIEKELAKEEIDESAVEELTKQEEELEGVTEGYSYEMIDSMHAFIGERFREGKIFDENKSAIREMVKEDIFDFDNEIITAISQKVFGTVPKKG